VFVSYIEFKDTNWNICDICEIKTAEFHILKQLNKIKRGIPIDASLDLIKHIKQFKKVYVSYLTLNELREISIHSKGIDEIIDKLTELEIEKIFCHKCIRIIFAEVDGNT